MTADHIERAAETIYVEVLGLPDYSPDAVDDHNRHSYRGDCECNASDRADARHAAQELAAAGLLVTPKHDAAVAARALRDAAPRFRHDRPSASVWAEMLDLADQIEAGESGADA